MFSNMSTTFALSKASPFAVFLDSEFSFDLFNFEDAFSFFDKKIYMEGDLLIFILKFSGIWRRVVAGALSDLFLWLVDL